MMANAMHETVRRVAQENPSFITARIAEAAGCSPQQTGRILRKVGITPPKATPGNGLGRKCGPKQVMVSRSDIDARILRNDLSYDPVTGVFRWKASRSRIQVGDIAGTLQSGYWMIHLRGIDYHAHRLAWLYHFGRWPNGEVDHINRNRLDNRICNLREASRSQNNANIGIPAHNTSGFKGVSYHKRTCRWMASIRCSGKRRYLGMFSTAEAAAAAYDQAAIDLFGEFARTNAMIHREAA